MFSMTTVISFFLSLPVFTVKVVMPVFSVLAVLPCVFSDASVYSDISVPCMMPFVTVIGEIQPVVNKAGPESA